MMEPQPTIQVVGFSGNDDPAIKIVPLSVPAVDDGIHVGAGWGVAVLDVFSLFEGGDWYQKGNVGFRGKPCDNPICDNGRITVSYGGKGCAYWMRSTDCPSCHGWGVTPIDGRIEWRHHLGDHLNADGSPACCDSRCQRVLVSRIDKDGGT